MQNNIRTALAFLGGALALWLGVTYFLPAMAPFAIGLAVAAAAQPLVRVCQRTLRLPRWAASSLCVSAVFAVTIFAVWLLARTAAARLGTLAAELPGIFRTASDSLEHLSDALSQRAPAELEDTVRLWADSLLARGAKLGERLSDAALRAMGGAVAALPEALLFTVTAVLSSFMLCARLPDIKRAIRQRLPLQTRARLRRGLIRVRAALSGWCRAQLRLLGVSFAIVTAGLFVLRVPGWLGLGLLIAVVDALPVLGTGTILLPWAAVCLLRGATRRGIGLALLYAAAALTRTSLEPRLLGRHLGLSPLITLAALYAGFRLCGVAGMLLFPIGAIVGKQLIEAWGHAQTEEKSL